MNSRLLLFLFTILPALSYSFEGLDESTDVYNSDEYILCRGCGSDISSSNYIFTKTSKISRHSFNDTLFGKDDVLVQFLSNNIFFEFPVITFVQSTCVTVGEWEESDSWFPGYHWKPCVCPECGAYLGMVFEPINYNLGQFPKQFYGLILPSLIGESFTNSLTKYPIN